MSAAGLDVGRVRGGVHAALAETEPSLAEAVRRAPDLWLRSARQWESSEGAVTGWLVGLAVDAATLGAIHAHPHLGDALLEAFAGEIARARGASLAELRVYWSGIDPENDAYRGAIGASADLVVATAKYLAAFDEEPGTIEVAVDAARDEADRLVARVRTGDDESFAATARALRALLAGADAARVKVVRVR